MKSSVAAVVPGHAQAGGIRIARGSIRASISQHHRLPFLNYAIGDGAITKRPRHDDDLKLT
jgi:hypothetical protein